VKQTRTHRTTPDRNHQRAPDFVPGRVRVGVAPQNPFGPATRAADVLLLQRLAGNEAVTAELEVQRYEAGEHAQFGAEAGTAERQFVLRLGSTQISTGVGDVQKFKDDKKVLVMSYGEVIALGDFYKDFDQLRQATQSKESFTELRELVRLVRKDVEAYTPGHTGTKPVTNEEFQQATAGRKEEEQYVNLSAANAEHFDPPTTKLPDTAQKGDNKSTWYGYHLAAIEKASAGKTDEALLMNAFADHFLTDAFSAGHIVSKAELMDRARAKVDKLAWHGYTWYKKLVFRSSVFTDRLAADILADPEGAKLYDYQVNLGQVGAEWHDMSAQVLSPLIGAVMQQQADDILSLFAKAVHDWLNVDIEKRWGGLEVQNNVNLPWRLSGDGTLAASDDTLKIARHAVARSQQDIVDAGASSRLGPQVKAQEMADRVWDFVPHPTKNGQAKIDQVVAELTDPERPETAQAISGIAVKNLPIMIDLLVNKKKRLRLKPAPSPGATAPAHPTPALVPSPR
jgi:hypothetical protein